MDSSTGYGFPAADSASYTHCPSGSPRFLDRSLRARCPLSPREVRRLHPLVSSSSVAGFVIFGSLATPTLCNEAASGSLSLRLTRSLPGAPPVGSLQPTSGSLPVVRAIDRATSFQIARSTRLSLAHRRHEAHEGRTGHQLRALRAFVVCFSPFSVPGWPFAGCRLGGCRRR